MKNKIVFQNLEYTIARAIVDENYGKILKCVRITEDGLDKIYIRKINNVIEKIDDIELNKILNEKYDYVEEVITE